MKTFGRHTRYLSLARILAHSAIGNHKHGCVIVSGGRILAKGRNSYDNDIHAECNALGKNWLSEFKGATMYIARIRKQQMYGLSRPCPKCEEMIRQSGISRIVYSTNDVENPIAFERI